MEQDKLQLQLLRSYLDNTQITLQMAHYTKVGANWRVTNMMTDVNRFYFIREGGGWIHIRGKDYNPKAGELYLLPAGMKLSYAPDNADPLGKYWCHFSATVGDVNLFQMLDLPHCIQVRDEARLEKQFQRLLELHASPSVSAPLRIKAVLFEMISEYIEQSESELHLAATSSTSKINIVLSYIERHLAEPISVEELAKLIHFHPNYFMHYFKSMMGLSPIVYINKKRLEKARRMLATTDLSVSAIAEEIGLELYYFSRIFKKQSGLSPSEYRKASGKALIEDDEMLGDL
ncbi:AraC family transcriptional regulator [Paenibacillus doosanensis]|uniref:HTH-type transcriptional activator Btr n=1 Tax=Paenibacillus konkukensis TaxID=2020716 RepID=A0ABY4RRY2_9BACL|nr:MULTISPECIES: AraC family transcriptional regulator [Paenibacillus]MCS7461247.1 AraC family transcriptional regulator [Paenibacillus doosanensis]UQZ85311.1 HTH-type transcriptional activator Btr [Paenibacillus konkukensis]